MYSHGFFFFSSRRRHTRYWRDWSSDVCSSDLWVAAQDKAVKLYRDDPQAASAAVAAELNLKPEEALAQMRDLIFLDASEQVGPDALGGGLGEALAATATFNKELGQIPRTQDPASYGEDRKST